MVKTFNIDAMCLESIPCQHSCTITLFNERENKADISSPKINTLIQAIAADKIVYGEEKDHTVLELTHNWDQAAAYDLGDAYGHVAIGVPDIYGVCETLEKAGVSIPRPPGPMKFSSTVIAFVEDPDGYKVELIERS